MSDGRKKNGGARPNSGPKPKAERLGLERLLDRCWTKAQRAATLKALAQKAGAGDMESIKLLMAYTYGKPVERKEVGSDADKPVIIRVTYEGE